MKQGKQFLARVASINLVAASLIFSTGLLMSSGKHECRHKVIAALKAHKTHDAALALAEWCKTDPHYKKDPAFYLACAIIHHSNGNTAAVDHNLNIVEKLTGHRHDKAELLEQLGKVP